MPEESALRKRPTKGIRSLVIARSKQGAMSAFVVEQARALAVAGVDVEMEGVGGAGAWSYVRFAQRLENIVVHRRIDIVHAHFGVTGLAATWQTRVPTIITFHGSDINHPRLRQLSRLAARRASACIVVSTELRDRAGFSCPPEVIPCGIDLDMFFPDDRTKSRLEFGFGDEPVVVFASSRDRWVKNFPLAEAAVCSLAGVRLVEVKDLSRVQVRKLLSAADVLLMTSRTEGSPQIIKEALATGCPVVSTDVGDVRSLIAGIDGCYLTSTDVRDIAEKVARVLASGQRVSGRERMHAFSNATVARRIRAVYERVLDRDPSSGVPSVNITTKSSERGQLSDA